ncbi:MAG: hypothetical protein U5N53_14105 [Mycobacterium sp.]|nr:hypothetical protein [Mycobacterium sp.]
MSSTATAMAATIAVSAPVPTPPALLAQERHSVSLTAASTPYQQAQNVINTLLSRHWSIPSVPSRESPSTHCWLKYRRAW